MPDTQFPTISIPPVPDRDSFLSRSAKRLLGTSTSDNYSENVLNSVQDGAIRPYDFPIIAVKFDARRPFMMLVYRLTIEIWQFENMQLKLLACISDMESEITDAFFISTAIDCSEVRVLVQFAPSSEDAAPSFSTISIQAWAGGIEVMPINELSIEKSMCWPTRRHNSSGLGTDLRHIIVAESSAMAQAQIAMPSEVAKSHFRISEYKRLPLNTLFVADHPLMSFAESRFVLSVRPDQVSSILKAYPVSNYTERMDVKGSSSDSLMTRIVSHVTCAAVDSFRQASGAGMAGLKSYWTNSSPAPDSSAILILDIDKSQTLAIFYPPEPVSYISLAPNGLSLATASARGNHVYIWNLLYLPRCIMLDHKCTRGFSSASVYGISWDLANSLVAVMTSAGSIHMFGFGRDAVSRKTASPFGFHRDSTKLWSASMGYTNGTFNLASNMFVGLRSGWILDFYDSLSPSGLPVRSVQLPHVRLSRSLEKRAVLYNSYAAQKTSNSATRAEEVLNEAELDPSGPHAPIYFDRNFTFAKLACPYRDVQPSEPASFGIGEHCPVTTIYSSAVTDRRSVDGEALTAALDDYLSFKDKTEAMDHTSNTASMPVEPTNNKISVAITADDPYAESMTKTESSETVQSAAIIA
ncbi:hypothetical protein CANCADRAFT_4110 [Tortispora caseinolytica NRRL Y-17796]|uniref:BCAS3 domain-containing protein n=1 Tax=Tortispora caseinolytica NRRL Y-17796 TaxID=767744 RepID=A0A1E4TCL8_9ASCO|nr:hypothetical protein CANCADRAFT_4110 [Tortispora caseinolytica NRRL Y-17796]